MDSLTAIAAQRGSEETHSSSVREVDPTSLEFESLFRRICSKALAATSDTRLVVVMDNLDRIDSADALQLWSTMRTFTELPHHEESLSGLWVLVPFDPDGLGRLWRSLSAPSPTIPDTSSLADAFLEKTFQVRYQLPAPTASVSRRFFVDELSASLPRHSEDDVNDVHQLYRVLGEGRAVTPRNVRLFVNRMAASHSQWTDEIPLQVQALYLLKSPKIGSDGRGILEEDFLESAIRPLVESISREWRGQIASLHFNVPIDVGIEVVLRPALLDGLDSLEVEEVARLLGTSERAPAILWELIEEGRVDWVSTDSDLLAKSGVLLKDLQAQQVEVPDWVWRSLSRGVMAVERWPVLNRDVGRGITAINEQASILPARLAQSVSASEPPTGEESEVGVWAGQWLEGIAELVASSALVADSPIHMSGGAVPYLEVLSELSGMEASRARVRAVIQGPEESEIAQAVSDAIRTEFSTKLHGSIDQLIAGRLLSDWTPICAAIDQRFTASADFSVAESGRIVRTLLRLRREESARSTLEALCVRGDVLHYLWKTMEEKEPSTAGLLILAMLLHRPDGDATAMPGRAPDGQVQFFQVIDNPRGDEVLSGEIASWARRYSKAGNFRHLGGPGHRHQALIAALIADVVALDGGEKWLGYDFIVGDYEMVKAALDEEGLSRVVAALDSSGAVTKALVAGDFDPALAQLYLQVVSASGSIARSTANWLKHGLDAITRDAWTGDIASEATLLHLAVAIRKRGVSLELGAALSDALLVEVDRAVTDAGYETLNQSDWSGVTDCLADDPKQTFFRDVRDRLIIADGAGTGSVIWLLGSLLAEAGVLEEKADDLIRQLARAAVERSDSDTIDAFMELVQLKPSILTKAPASSISDLTSRAKSKLEEETEESAIGAALTRLVRKLTTRK